MDYCVDLHGLTPHVDIPNRLHVDIPNHLQQKTEARNCPVCPCHEEESGDQHACHSKNSPQRRRRTRVRTTGTWTSLGRRARSTVELRSSPKLINESFRAVILWAEGKHPRPARIHLMTNSCRRWVTIEITVPRGVRRSLITCNGNSRYI